MRLHRLEVAGFGPFRERQVVDFDAFADDGIFLIAGRTGAGKSSILDAVCFGLYGSVPRYEGGEKRLRSDHCEPDDPSEVQVEFSTSAGRFRVTRSPEYQRPAKRGGGLTTQPSAVALEERGEQGWRTLAAKERLVAHELDAILQLSRDQFLQVILLAQNRFARFLLADSKERQGLLRRLFGTQRFEDVQSRFEDRRRASENALGARLATLTARIEEAEALVAEGGLQGETLADQPGADAAIAPDGPAANAGSTGPAASTVERLDALRRASARAGYRAERAAAERDDAEAHVTRADAALADLREARSAQQERDRARTALAALDAERPKIDAAVGELAEARAAEQLRAVLAATRRTEEALSASRAAEEAARLAWDERGAASDIDASQLLAWIEEQTRLLGTWERAIDAESRAAARAEEADEAAAEVATLTARVDALDAGHAALPCRRAELALERDAARRSADRQDTAVADLERARSRAKAAADAVRLAADVETAEGGFALANAALATAQTDLSDLLRRRLGGMAGELAGGLVAGEPCAVCGSLEHPSPAAHTDPVSADDVAAAQQLRDDAATTERAAGEALSAVRIEHTAALTIADGRSAEQAAEEVAQAVAARDEAASAAGRVQELDAQLSELDAQADRHDEERAAAASALATAREALAVLHEREREAEELISAARGAFASVAARVADTRAALTAARALTAAVEETRRRADAAAEAQREQDAAIADSAFPDAAAVESALRSPQEQSALDARITQHAVRRETEKAILLPLEMRTLPEDPIDPTPAEQTARSARTAWTEAVRAAGAAEATVTRLNGLIASADEAHAQTSADAAEHEVLRGLADVIAGRGANTHRMTLETFVLAAELEEIVAAANRRLSAMSDGRYELQHSDARAARGAASGLGIVVFDAFTGRARPAQSLSGGETFLGSLALALGLAEVVTARAGGIRLDTLFIDEGFGSLDADTLEVAMRTLDELRAGGRTVGVISHVEAMQEQIPAQIRVEQTEEGPSRIR